MKNRRRKYWLLFNKPIYFDEMSFWCDDCPSLAVDPNPETSNGPLFTLLKYCQLKVKKPLTMLQVLIITCSGIVFSYWLVLQ
jgi:hypothetical protein